MQERDAHEEATETPESAEEAIRRDLDNWYWVSKGHCVECGVRVTGQE